MATGLARRGTVAPWQVLGNPWGHTSARRAAPLHCGTPGSQAPKRDGWFSTTWAGPPPPNVRAASQARPEKATRPPPHARSRGSRRPADIRPRDPYFKYDLWSRFHCPPPPPRAHNGLCVLCVFHLGFVCPRSPRGPPLRARFVPPRQPLRFALGCPCCAPEPSGAHTQDRFLSSFFSTLGLLQQTRE